MVRVSGEGGREGAREGESPTGRSDGGRSVVVGDGSRPISRCSTAEAVVAVVVVA